MIRFQRLKNRLIAYIEILGKHDEDRKVVNPDYALYKCDKARVITIYHMDTEKIYQKGNDMNNNLKYKIGKKVTGEIYYYKTEIAAFKYSHYFDLFELKENYTGNIKTYYPDGQISTIYNYLLGKKHGEWLRWWDNGNLHRKLFYENNREQGIQLYYHENGNLSAEYNMDKGLKEGIAKIYNEKGCLSYTLEYKNDQFLNIVNYDENEKEINKEE